MALHQPSNLDPTRQNYAELQTAYEHFNAALFAGKLPSCLITLQREKRTCGYIPPAQSARLCLQGASHHRSMRPARWR